MALLAAGKRGGFEETATATPMWNTIVKLARTLLPRMEMAPPHVHMFSV